MQVTGVSLVSRPASVQEARDWLTALLERWGTERARHNAALLLSEVVTNAVGHARGGTIQIAVALSERQLRARVRDDSSQRPVRRHPGATGGWGLGLLDELSAQWGVEPHPDGGKTVWFVIDDG